MQKLGILLLFIAFSASSSPHFCAQGEKTFRAVDLETLLGPIRIALFDTEAPNTAANFADYVNQGFYDETVIHAIERRMLVRAGIYDVNHKAKAPIHAPIKHESNGIKHKPMRVGMWRSEHPDTATSEFFINLGDNTTLNIPYGYTVFGEVIKGKDRVKRMQYTFLCQNIEKSDSDCKPIVIHSAKLVNISCDAQTKAAS